VRKMANQKIEGQSLHIHRVLRLVVLGFLPAFLLMSLFLILNPAPAASESPTPPQPVVLRADEAGIVLEWRAPAFSLRGVTGEDGRVYSVVEAPGWERTTAPGQPQLPFASALAVVPPEGDVTLRVQVLTRERSGLSHPVMPAPEPMPVGSPVAGLAWAWARDEQVYARGDLCPAEVVTLEEVGWMRGRRLVRVTFHPLRFEPADVALEVARQVRVELLFQGEAVAASEWSGDDPFDPVLQHAVINPAQVTQFVRWAGVAPTRLGPQEGAAAPADTEYLIIAHSDFMDAVAPLAAHRANEGLQVFSATVGAIYAAYSEGSVSATAIRDYISATYHSSSPPVLGYVLLVGDGVTGTVGQYVPPYMIDDVLEPGRKTASDNRFVTVDGSNNVADIFIGRLPVNSAAQAQIVVGKILAYEQSPPQWPWNERVLFFSGNEDPSKPEETFHDDSNAVYATLPAAFSGQRVYFCTDSCTQPYHHDTITSAHDATMMQLNAGGLLAGYMGHSSWHQWAVDPQTWAPMFHLDHVAGLHNGGALSVFLEMTCYTSRFFEQSDTLDESLLRRAGGGAVATFGPTALACSSGHRTMYHRFFHAVFSDGKTELGAVIEYAKVGLGNENMDLHDTYILLGDPALDLNLTIVPWTARLFLPAVMRNG
jgi:hypothetical protein